MKTQLLAGVALALVLGVSSAAYANPKNVFSANNTTEVSSNAIAVSVGNASVGNGNGNGNENGNASGNGVSEGSYWGFGKGKGGDLNGSGNGNLNGNTSQTDGAAYSSAISESFNKNNDGVSVQSLAAVSAVNVQSAEGYFLAKNHNDGATSKNIHTDGIAVSGAAAGLGTQNVQGVSIGAAAEVSF
jgi:hypothetical protein